MPWISTLTGCEGLSLSTLSAYFRIYEFNRTLGGGSAASTSIGLIGAVLKTPSILRTP